MNTHFLRLRFYFTIISILLTFSACKQEKDIVDRPTPTTTLNGDGLVTVQEAEGIARAFIAHNFDAVSSLRSTRDSTLKLIYTDLGDLRTLEKNKAIPTYYVFNIDTVGFVIVSASESTLPILAYSEESAFSPTDIPDAMKTHLSNMTEEVRYSFKYIKADQSIEAIRKKAIEGNLEGLRTTRSVAPLLGRIKWNQRPYYNEYCPEGTPVGCVATATAQIMKYYEYPDRGEGEHSYVSSYGVLSFNYDYPIRWDLMPARTLTAANKHVAYFNYGVAVALNMGFGPNGSGTWQWRVPNALRTYYKYPNTVENRDRSDYTYEQWKAIIRRELDAGRPVQYCGGGTGGAHSFVCDGYTASGYFHFNWGWGGMSDGYFLLHALNPGSLGTGGGAGGYNNNQSIVVGFAPPEGHNPINRDEYCESGSQYSCTTYISRVSLGGVANTTNGCTTGGYSLFDNLNIELKQGEAYALQVAPGFSNYVYPEYWRVWIDYNGDKQFDDSEIILAGQTNTRSGLERTITIPQDAQVGTTRMRVSMKWGAYPTACEVFKHGEVEDYEITITRKTSPTPQPRPTPEPAPGGYCGSQGWNSCSTYIAGVQLANINNISEGCTKGYKYFDGITIKLEPSKQYTLILTPGFRTTAHDEYWRAWIDYNDNKIFETNEVITFGKSSLRTPLSKTFIVPTHAVTAKTLRMRVSMSYDSYAEPCSVFDHGEVEDYNVIIEKPAQPSPSPNPSPRPTPNPNEYCTPSSQNSTEAYIRFVELGNIEHQSTYHNGGYSNFTAKYTSVASGGSLRYTISPNNTGTNPYFYRIWIDYNNNKTFEGNEIVLETSDAHSIYGRITLKQGLKSGLYRVRIAMSTTQYSDGCEVIDAGEYEDYSIWIR